MFLRQNKETVFVCLSLLISFLFLCDIKFLLTYLLKHGLEVAVWELHLASTPEERLTQKGSHLLLDQTDQLHTAARTSSRNYCRTDFNCKNLIIANCEFF